MSYASERFTVTSVEFTPLPPEPAEEKEETELKRVYREERECDPPPPHAIRKDIEATLDDMVSNLLYYNRKEDDDLPPGAIEAAIADGVISVDEIVARFRGLLEAE